MEYQTECTGLKRCREYKIKWIQPLHIMNKFYTLLVSNFDKKTLLKGQKFWSWLKQKFSEWTSPFQETALTPYMSPIWGSIVIHLDVNGHNSTSFWLRNNCNMQTTYFFPFSSLSVYCEDASPICWFKEMLTNTLIPLPRSVVFTT